jgi:hypothetical protein
MKKRYLIIALILMFIPFCVYAEKSILERKPELKKYDYNYNLTTLQQDLYPTIYKKLSTVKLNPYTKEKGEALVDEISEIVNDYHDKNKLRYTDVPKIVLLAEEMPNKTISCYVIISMYLLEADPKANITGLFTITKFFYVDKINIEPQKENTIPEKKLGSSI